MANGFSPFRIEEPEELPLSLAEQLRQAMAFCNTGCRRQNVNQLVAIATAGDLYEPDENATQELVDTVKTGAPECAAH